MNFYKHYIGDFQRDTGHLSLTERGAYLTLIHHYYATEMPLPKDINSLCRIAGAVTKSERDAVKAILVFFEPMESGLVHARIEAEIQKAGEISGTNRSIALAREAARRAKKEERELERNDNDSSTIRAQSVKRTVSRNKHEQSTPQTPYTNKEKEIAAAAYNSPGADPVDNSPPSQNDFKNKSTAERSVEIAVLVRQWETARGKSSRATGKSPHIEVWTEHEITDRQLREAYDLAVEDRIRNEDDGPISPAFLDVFVAKVFQRSESTSALKRQGASATSKPWQSTWSGILAKAAELGIEKRDGEFDPQFKERIFSAAEMTGQEKSALRADYGLNV